MHSVINSTIQWQSKGAVEVRTYWIMRSARTLKRLKVLERIVARKG